MGLHLTGGRSSDETCLLDWRPSEFPFASRTARTYIFPMSQNAIEPPDSHILNAAVGWAELGLPVEALIELSRLSISLLGHPDVLNLRWRLHAMKQDWEGALTVARAQLAVDPEQPDSWINLSFALHELKRTREAFDALVSVQEKFPKTGVIPYNLACYSCRLGELDDARVWIRRARKILGKDQLREMGSDDPDLQPLRAELG
jgi:tetratricopeptide (TPR) repeat protein